MMKIGKGNQELESDKQIRLTLEAYGKIQDVLDMDIPLSLKTNLYNQMHFASDDIGGQNVSLLQIYHQRNMAGHMSQVDHWSNRVLRWGPWERRRGDSKRMTYFIWIRIAED